VGGRRTGRPGQLRPLPAGGDLPAAARFPRRARRPLSRGERRRVSEGEERDGHRVHRPYRAAKGCANRPGVFRRGPRLGGRAAVPVAVRGHGLTPRPLPIPTFCLQIYIFQSGADGIRTHAFRRAKAARQVHRRSWAFGEPLISAGFRPLLIALVYECSPGLASKLASLIRAFTPELPGSMELSDVSHTASSSGSSTKRGKQRSTRDYP
jgi:hypothetical protein